MNRFARSWALTRQSYRVLMQDKELLVLPILSGVTLLAILATFVAGFWISGVPVDRVDKASLSIAGVLGYVITYTVGFFFQAALVAGALERMAGGDPTVGSALRAAGRRFGAILTFGLIAGTVGAVLRAIQDRSELVGKIVAGLLGAAWSLATFFLVPVVVMEERSIGESFKRSATLFRDTWGETMLGGAGVGLASFLVMFPIVAVAFALGAMTTPLIGLMVGLPLVVIASVFFAALQNVYVAALYRYATTGTAPEEFDARTVTDAFGHTRR